LLGNNSVNIFPWQQICKQQWNNSVDMQWRCKHAFPTIERLCFLHGPCKAVIKKNSKASSSSIEQSQVQDASLLGYELGIELSWQLQNNGKKGIRL
jgi:hypothetical protein